MPTFDQVLSERNNIRVGHVLGNGKLRYWALFCLNLITGVRRVLDCGFESQVNDIAWCLFFKKPKAFMLVHVQLFYTSNKNSLIALVSIWRLLLWLPILLLWLGKAKGEHIHFLASCYLLASPSTADYQVHPVFPWISPILTSITGWKTDRHN